MKRKMNIGVAFVMTALIGLVLFQSAFGQTAGQISGIVKDPNGAIVPGASVTLTSTSTGAVKTATTDSDGYYIFPNVQPGEYNISVKAGSFKEQSQKVQLSVGGATTANVTLGIEVSANVVDVTAGAGGLAEVNVTDQQQSTVIGQRQLGQLPSLDRNPYNLVNLSGNVSTADPSGRGVGVAINGQRAASTNILLDGVENVATFTATVSQSVPADSVAEFRVITSNFSAEYGRASGGIVNVATKAGGNSFTGSLWAQNRNSVLAANGFDNNANGIERPHYNRNQYGGGLTGPVIKNKLFFSDFIEFTKIRSTATVLAWVPTQAFIASAAPNVQQFFSTYGQLRGTPTGQVNVGEDVPAGTFRLVRYDSPADAGGGTPVDGLSNAARVDWNLTDKTSVYFSYKTELATNPLGTVFDSPWEGYRQGAKTFNQNFLVSATHTFTPNFLFDGKFAYRRAKSTFPLGGKDPNTPTLYWFDQATPTTEGHCIDMPGYVPCSPGAGLNAPELEQLYDVKPNFSWIIGGHNIRFGGQYVRLNDDTIFGAYQNASEGLSGGSPSQAYSNFLSGTTVRHQVAVDPQGRFPGDLLTLPVKAPNFERNNLYNEFAIYGMDSWRITPTFTLTAGLRYEYYGTQKSSEGLDSNFYFGSGSNIYEQIRNGFAGIATDNGGLWKPGKAWAPRIGFAWDIFGDAKTSLRGGYGISYERNFGNVTFNVIQNPPFYAVLSVPGTVTVNNFGPLAANSGTAQLPRTSLRAVDPNINQAYAHQWGVSIEREIARNTVVKLDYSGSAGRNLYSIANINRVGFGTYYLGTTTSNCNGLSPGLSAYRLNCQYSNINFRGSDGQSNYYSFTPALESSNLFGTGMTITARYTWSRSKDNLSSTFSESGNNFNLGYVDPFNPMLDYGYADFDMRHRVVTSAIYPIPFKYDNKVAKAILGDWTISGIVNYNSGTPFTIWDVSGFNVTSAYRLASGGKITFNNPTAVDAGSPNRFDYITVTGANSYLDDLGIGNETGPYPSNMTRRNAYRGPSYWNADMSIFKNIRLTERYNMQIRLDALNVFNHANVFVDGANAYVISEFDEDGNIIPNTAKGTINTYKSGQRNVQVSARFWF